MKPEHTRRLIGGLAVLLGLGWTWVLVFPTIGDVFSEGLDRRSVLLTLIFVPLLALPAILAVTFGVCLFREFDESYLKLIIGFFAICFATLLFSQALAMLPPLLPEDLQGSILLFVGSVVAIVAYLFTARVLLRYFTKEEHSFGSLINRGVLILMAWQLWLLLSGICQMCFPMEDGFGDFGDEPWELLRFFVPMALAYGCFRFFASKLPKEPSDADQPMSAS